MNDLSLDQLREVRDQLINRIEEGLSGPDQEVRCIPAYLRPPKPGLRGQAIVVDAGGTNMRAAWLELGDGEPKFLAGPFSGLLPDGRERPCGREEFFEAQAELVRRLGAPKGLPLGYCFSYPAEVTPEGDARLLHWTKSIQVTGVEGTLVGTGLAETIGGVSQVKVLNDTVAALMGGAALGGGKFDNYIGLIVGTGTNMATFIEERQIVKLGRTSGEYLAVNLESGNYNPPHLTQWDDEVDQASNNPGKQRFEKAVSGFYLPYVFERVCPGVAGFDPKEGSGQLSAIAQSQDARAARAARWVLDRSADLVAAGLAAVAHFSNLKQMGVQAEGGLFWKVEGYSSRVQQALTRLSTPPPVLSISPIKDVNLVGAACAALT